ncbi:MAG TPA: hypothetical protein VIV56_09835, partial [Gemmatimonadales bacterium]
SSTSDDVLVFLDRPTLAGTHRGVLETLADRIGAETSAAGREEAARGERPLLRVPAEGSARIIERLGAHGLPGRVESLPPPWRTTVPPTIAGFAGLVGVGGSLAGAFAGLPVLLLFSPLVAVAIVSAAAVGRRAPVWNPPLGRPGTLPSDVEREAVRTVAALPEGPARRLLLDLLRRASASPAGSGSLGPLVGAACSAARELAALESHLESFDSQTDRWADPPATWLDAVTRCERGRDALVQRLLEAIAALSSASGERALRAASPGEALATLTRDLDEEGRLQAEAAREVEALLAR